MTPPDFLTVQHHGDGIVVIHMEGGNVLSSGMIAGLLRAFSTLREDGTVRVLLLTGTADAFLNGDRDHYNEALELGLVNAVAAFPCPVIAVMQGDASGAGFLLAALCDFMVCAETARYKFPYSPCAGEERLLAERFGPRHAADFLHHHDGFTGTQLQDRGWRCPILPQGQVEAHAHALAQRLASKSPLSMRLLKQHLSRDIQALAQACGDAEPAESIEVPCCDLLALMAQSPAVADQPCIDVAAVPLSSSVISATVHPGGIVLVRMADLDAKNMFSEKFIEGMREAFAHIAATPSYKVVVLTGYDSYFACGGTREALVAIQSGAARFTDDATYRLALDCAIPVIAAMQGHAIGGGLSLGLFADVILLSEESKFFSPYMAYGFTPGAGATLIVPIKMGHDLARETLMTAGEYSGSELKARRLAHAVLPRKQVVAAAMELAANIAQHPRASLVQWKQQANRAIHKKLADNTRLELAMHEQTFAGQAGTLEQIHKVFDPMQRRAPPQSAAIIARLKSLLAEELHLGEKDIDDEAQFVDLGLDSITGVTWMRKINAHFKTQIAAIKVYSYPNLAQLAAHVLHELEGSAPAPHPDPRPADSGGGIKLTLKQLLAHELHMDEHDIDEDAQFVDLGLDSITGVTWMRKVNATFGTQIAAITVYSYPTVRQLAAHVSAQAAAAVPAPPAPIRQAPAAGARPKLVSWRAQKSSRAAPQVQSQAIAVIGMAGQFPQARTLDAFWHNIAEGRNCITEVDPQRWSVDTWYRAGEPVAGKTNSRWMGALDDYAMFDPLFFNISPGEAQCMDPQQRLFLEACWHSIENAGYNPRSLSGAKCGVFAGCGSGDYQLQSQELRLSAQGFTGSAPSILAARISYFLNLQGPCISIDTACSSSLVALANACDSLNAGASDLALAGGVYVTVGAEMQVKTAQAGMLSRDGRCYTFDQRANGFVPGEAVGVVLLKRLADAERDGDPIHGLIQGWGINQDGKTNGITAPNPQSQTRLQQDVYDRFQIDPAQIQLIEAHGTATKLGDPIEVDALKASFKKYTGNKEYCALGSVKSNIGHCLQAAGIASFIKLMLALKHQQLPPTINFAQLNEHIDLRGSPFYVNTRLREWTTAGDVPRQAALSSFGFSGTNAHLVVRQYQPLRTKKLPVAAVMEDSRVVIALSAKTPEQLRQVAQDLLSFAQGDGAGRDLLDVAYTLQVGREAMDERVGLLVASMGELASKLQAYVSGETGIAGLYQGQVKRHREGLSLVSQDDEVRTTLVATWIGQKKLSKLVDWWVKGLAFDWNALYGEAKPARIALPTYPFARERYWFEARETRHDSVLHPLVHRNTSGLYQHSYGATFTGAESFLADHQLRHDTVAVPLLPGVAYLEMARAALAQALPDAAHDGAVELRDVVWLQPLIVTADREVMIRLSPDAAQIDFSVESTQNGVQVTHCEGRIAHLPTSRPARLDVGALMARMQGRTLTGLELYPMYSRMGLEYGQSHQGIAALHMGESELLARLQLPSPQGFVLAPGIADSALQATVGLIFDLDRLPAKPAVPFALESIAILAPCVAAMLVWVRYAAGSRAGDAVVKLDLDLCDESGLVCVAMRGFAARILDGVSRGDAPFDEVFYQGLIDGLLGDEMSIDDAAELG